MKSFLKIKSRKNNKNPPRSFGMILKGERLPSQELIFSLAKYLKLSKKKREYLTELVSLDKKRKNGKPLHEALDRLAKLLPKNSGFHLIDHNEFEDIASWYFLVIRQVFKQPIHEDSLHLLPCAFENRLSLKEIVEAISLLMRKNLLKKDPQGFISLNQEGIHTRSDIPSGAITRHHSEMLNQAKIHLSQDPVLEREFQSLTFRFKEENMKEAKKFIRDFKEEFNRQFACNEGDEVYQLGIQLFRHTHLKKDEE
jgi:uncharacterized protein (TIGR02147 family)